MTQIIFLEVNINAYKITKTINTKKIFNKNIIDSYIVIEEVGEYV